MIAKLAAEVRPVARQPEVFAWSLETALLAPRKDNPARLAEWTAATHETDLPHVHSFVRGIAQDIDAITAAITLHHHNGRTEGVNCPAPGLMETSNTRRIDCYGGTTEVSG
ncbi:transposase [Actinophytocola sp.]|uniref:transposase n=1 Tax=Actinophytocola sp. TaxID=1872138 RepID=UPI00389A088D